MPFRKAYGRKRYRRSVMALRSRKRRRTMAARRIQRAFRKRRPRTRFLPSAKRSCRRRSYRVATQQMKQQTLYGDWIHVASAKLATGTDALTLYRTSGKIWMEGVRIKAQFENYSLYGGFLHIALVQSTRDDQNLVSQLKSEMFSNRGDAFDKSVDFTDNTSTWQWYQDYLKLNSDRLRVITHKRIHLRPRGFVGDAVGLVGADTVDIATGGRRYDSRHIYTMDQYFPIKRFFSYDEADLSTSEHDICFLAWFVPTSQLDVNLIGTTDIISKDVFWDVSWKDNK